MKGHFPKFCITDIGSFNGEAALLFNARVEDPFIICAEAYGKSQPQVIQKGVSSNVSDPSEAQVAD